MIAQNLNAHIAPAPEIEKLKALALAAIDLPDTTQPFVSSTGQVVICTFSLKGEQLHTVGNFYDAANPATVLELIVRFQLLLADNERLRADAERFQKATMFEDNAEALYAAVLNHAPDGAAIRAEFDAAITASKEKA